MDAIDRTILAALQLDGRMTATDLANEIGLSLSATSERLRQLRANGVIRGFTVSVEPAAVGRPIEVLVDVRLAPGTPQEQLDAGVRSLPGVIDATHLTGRFDTQLRVAAADVAELNELLIRLKEELGVEETNTRLVLGTIDGFPRNPI